MKANKCSSFYAVCVVFSVLGAGAAAVSLGTETKVTLPQPKEALITLYNTQKNTISTTQTNTRIIFLA